MRQAKLNGRYSGMAPFGFLNAKDTDGRAILTIDEDKATIVRMIYREYLDGMPVEQLRAMASPYGRLPKGSSAMQKMLGNPVYAGLVHVPGTKGNQPSW
ncbi:recombinase family protein [Paraflavitalea speifideaquila]|uniref:recombinase family protein n=1 Tax=Paraflavitalea speifideaquila TaxID=3076558 RepID=UPI0028EF7EAD|nr:recombinase family protein [Paraflavitalea speifideiaquila]